MIILIGGMPRSGTTFLFNTVKEFFIRKNSVYVLGLIRAMSNLDTGWISAIRLDFGLLAHHEEMHPFVNVPVSNCIDIIAQDPRYWFNKIRRILRLPYYSIVTACDNEKTGDSIRAEISNFSCDICGAVRLSLKDINLHKFLSHGIRNPMYLYVDTTVCPVCLVEHHTRERVLTHIKKAKTCHSILLDRKVPTPYL